MSHRAIFNKSTIRGVCEKRGHSLFCFCVVRRMYRRSDNAQKLNDAGGSENSQLPVGRSSAGKLIGSSLVRFLRRNCYTMCCHGIPEHGSGYFPDHRRSNRSDLS